MRTIELIDKRLSCLPQREVLVTGGLGFIGSFVSESLAARGDHVTVVDSGVASVVEVNELDAGRGSIGYVPQDVVTFLKQQGSLGDFDLVVHCASFVGPASILGYTGKIAPAIITTTAHLIEACIEADVPLINFSSAEVYGKSGMLFEGSDMRIPPYYNARIEYALGKLSAEAMCSNNRERGLRSVTLRPFNVAGPRQSRFGGFVLPTFVQQALGGRPLTVFATGRQKRAFLAVADLCAFINDHLDPSVFSRGTVCNVGNPDNTTTIYDLAVRVRDQLGSSSEIVFVDARSIHGPTYQEAESFEKLPDIGIATALGWQPTIALGELIEQTAHYYRRHPDTRAEQSAAGHIVSHGTRAAPLSPDDQTSVTAREAYPQ